jgi:hypothetical protein
MRLARHSPITFGGQGCHGGEHRLSRRILSFSLRGRKRRFPQRRSDDRRGRLLAALLEPFQRTGEAASIAIVAVACAVYGWWSWSMAQAARASRGGLVSLILLCGLWAVANGASFVFTPLTDYVADVITLAR